MPEMRYVERKDGKIVAHYAHPSKHAQECLPIDHADLAAYREDRQRASDAAREKYSITALEARITALEAQVTRLTALLKHGGE